MNECNSLEIDKTSLTGQTKCILSLEIILTQRLIIGNDALKN